MKNTVIIGSSGFLGSAVTNELLSTGYRVYATCNRQPLRPQTGLTVLEGGIKCLTTEKLQQIKPEVIFHCARPVMPRLRRLGRVMAAMQASRLNTFLLAQISACEHKPQLIFASGSLVYGNSDLPHTEDAALNPVSYAREYHHGERPVLQAIREQESDVIMLRFPWMVGKGSWFAWFYLKQLAEHGQVPLFGNGGNLMSLISVSDAARWMVRMGNSEMKKGIFNVFSPFSLSQEEFARLVATYGNGTVTDYRNLFPGRVEKAVQEAFTSNIIMGTKHPGLMKDFHFQSPEEILKEIML
jgi:nucleoside-diphosphate-sugar epimerase